ncbi:pyridoxamine 5'-phosphate oxidase family protein [Kitasatospora paranensis]|uniref:Pyridoxamine 5'-phosphate oxidase family protein n=1 Tax=Kitasatospora paranensis TaxID=258053 RepID=A0ABW2FRH5_9ACTN
MPAHAAHGGDSPSHAGADEVGRRLAIRRTEAGLSTDQVASRSGLPRDLVEHLEAGRDILDPLLLAPLAAALGMRVSDLLRPTRPPDAGEPVVLEPWECWAKIAPRGLGRVAVARPDGLRVLPVNYRVLDGSILYRTAQGSPLADAVGRNVVFEADWADKASATGWSVVIAGGARAVTDPEALTWLAEHADPRPMAGGPRETWVRISPQQVTGRRVGPAGREHG